MLTACGDDEDERNAPPVGSGGGGGPSGGSSATAVGTDSATGGGSTGLDMTTGGPATATTMTSGPGSTTTGAPFAVLTGRFIDNDMDTAGWEFDLNVQCTVRFHQPGEINPANGVESATTFSLAFTIDAFPQPFTIMSDQIGDVVATGDPGYVTSECDIDGDNFFDDNAGGYFPGLPLTEITVPASSIDIEVGLL